ncbi:MAG: tetratricopeptide repeat protein, partial [Kouleothrix sp.]
MGDKYVTREHKGLFGDRYSVTTREKTVAEENAEIAKGIGTAAGVAGLLIGGMVKQHQDNKNRQLETMTNKGFTAINSGEYDQALEIGTRLVKMGSKEAKALGFTITGIALRCMERYDEAIQHLTSALDGLHALGEGQNAGNLYLHRGAAYLDKNDLSNAIRDFTTYINLNPNEDTGYYYRAQSLQRLGDPDQALANFAKAIALNPSDAANYRERGTLYTALNQSEKALEDYSRAITLAPRSAYSYKLRGKLYVAVSNYTKAIDDFSQAITLRQSDAESLQLRATAYQAIGEEAKAQADLDRASKLSNTLSVYQVYRQT